jgi:hypothetical protein
VLIGNSVKEVVVVAVSCSHKEGERWGFIPGALFFYCACGFRR